MSHKWRSEDSFPESIHSTFTWDPNIELRPAHLYSNEFYPLSVSLAPHIISDAVIFEYSKTLDLNFKMSMGLMFADMHNREI